MGLLWKSGSSAGVTSHEYAVEIMERMASREATKRHERQGVQQLKAEYLRAKARALRTNAGPFAPEQANNAKANYLDAKAAFIEKWETEDLPAFPQQVGKD